MAAYLAVLMQMARDKLGEGWLHYDHAFRQATVKQPDLQSATVLLFVHQSVSAAHQYLSPLFSDVVIPLYHLVSRNDRMQYDAPQGSC